MQNTTNYNILICLQDRERRGDELNELRFTLEENQKKVNVWETTAREKAKVMFKCLNVCFLLFT